jgi:hypothetical protein
MHETFCSDKIYEDDPVFLKTHMHPVILKLEFTKLGHSYKLSEF